MQFYIILLILQIGYQTECCTSFYCINSCGSSIINKGYKLILANNRDEEIYRSTQKADLWPNKNGLAECDSKNNHCVYGALDLKNGAPPNYYSTWLGINNLGNIGNLLFFMKTGPSVNKPKNRGIIVSNYLLKNINPEDYLQELTDEKSLYGPYNYVQLVMSNITGEYSLYYVNNNDTNQYKKMNQNDMNPFIFGLSNSDPNRPFQKVVKGQEIFEEIITSYGSNTNKEYLIESLKDLLQNRTENMPDETLAKFMGLDDELIISGVSKINANYSNFWPNAATRTSTVILVDYDNNVEYYEYNMSSLSEWNLNKFQFQLKRLHNSAFRFNFNNLHLIFSVLLFIKLY